MNGSQAPSSSVVRKTSPSTGLSYLTRAPRDGTVTKLCIFIHGWGCTALDYLPLLDALAATDPAITYIAPDLPGRGESPASLCPRPTLSAFAALLNNLCHEVCLAQDEPAPGGEVAEELVGKLPGTSSFPASGQSLLFASDVEKIVVGHSMGCRIALEVFAQEPRTVSRVVLLDGSWYGHSVKFGQPVDMTVDKEREVILKSLETMFGPNTPCQFRQYIRKQFQEIDLVYAMQLSRVYVAWDRERMEDVLCMARENKWNGGSRTSVLVIQATEGRGTTRRSLKTGETTSWMRFVQERVGQSYRGLIVADSGHWPHVDKTDEVAHSISNIT